MTTITTEKSTKKPRQNQRLRVLYLLKILYLYTDESNAITVSEIKSRLATYGISCERRSLYSCFNELQQFGIQIEKFRSGRTFYYRIPKRLFFLSELKVMVDSIQSFKFLTEKESKKLIHKIELLTSHSEADKLKHQVYVTERVKTKNADVFTNIDKINDAIKYNHQITFKYFFIDEKKEIRLKNNGFPYLVSPWWLVVSNEKYYLVAYDHMNKKLKHFRIDKIISLKIMPERREGYSFVKDINPVIYAKKMFGMFGGKEYSVKIKCKNIMANSIVDRFGMDVLIIPRNDEEFITIVNVAVSPKFIHWVLEFGDNATIIGPEPVVCMVKEEIVRLSRQYDV